jgi:hypothetical protein
MRHLEHQVPVELPDWYPEAPDVVLLDAGIAPLVEALWACGIWTNMSCQGDPGRDVLAWVNVEDPAAAQDFAVLATGSAAPPGWFFVGDDPDDTCTVAFPPAVIPALTAALLAATEDAWPPPSHRARQRHQDGAQLEELLGRLHLEELHCGGHDHTGSGIGTIHGSSWAAISSTSR